MRRFIQMANSVGLFGAVLAVLLWVFATAVLPIVLVIGVLVGIWFLIGV